MLSEQITNNQNIFHIEDALTYKTFFINETYLSNPHKLPGDNTPPQPLNLLNEEIVSAITAQIQANLTNKSLINRLAKLLSLFTLIADKENQPLYNIASNPHHFLTKYNFEPAKDSDRLFVINDNGDIIYQNEWAYLNELPDNEDGSAPQPNNVTDRYNFTSNYLNKQFSENAKFLKPMNSEAKTLYKQAELNSNKFIWTIRVNAIYESIMSSYNAAHLYSEEEKQTFSSQLQEAKSFIANPSSSTPLLDTIAKLRGIDKVTLANKVISKHNEQMVFYASINATKAKLLQDINNARDKTEVREISLAPLKRYANEIGR